MTAALTDRRPLGADHSTGVVWKLRLYVAGQSPKSLRASSNLRRLCEQHLAGRFEIEVVDLAEHPERAGRDNIIAIPTLIRCAPEPVRRTIGDLSDSERVLAVLEHSTGFDS